MIVIALILLIALVGSLLRVGLIEFVLGILLAAPLLWQVLVRTLVVTGTLDSTPPHEAMLVLYLVVLGGLLAAGFLVFERRSLRDLPPSELLPLSLWIVSFGVALYFCRTWPDFFQMGERFRDYALLAASVKSPIIPVEPWMSGATINYYIYWYRFGQMLSTLVGYPVWEMYHILVAFSLSTYLAVLFRLMTRTLGFGVPFAAIVAIAISFGSNVKGIIDWYNGDLNWWGPSRVVKGAINEFPAWSFLLGDLHPHYANLCTFPFLLLLLSVTWNSKIAAGEKTLYTIFLAAFGHVFLFGSNAWEIPMWWGTLAAFLVVLAARPTVASEMPIAQAVQGWWAELQKREKIFAGAAMVSSLAGFALLVSQRGKVSSALLLGLGLLIILFLLMFIRPQVLLRRIAFLTDGINRNRILAWGGLTLLLVVGCILGSKHIVPEGGELRFVRSPIPLTTVNEMFLHWGIPVTLIAVATPLLFTNWLVTAGIAAAIGISFLVNDAVLLIFVLAFVQLCRIRAVPSAMNFKKLAGDSVLIAGLGLLLLPEFVFLDDPYGGENERMNTIFKIYTTAWFLIHVGAAYLIILVCRRYSTLVSPRASGYLSWGGWLTSAAVTAIMIGYFTQTIGVRRLTNKHVEPYTRGLSEVEGRYPGSKTIIDYLTQSKPVVVLETQGNAYDFTTFVTTLSGQTAFLGWSNHVGLLTKKHDEVGRREKRTEEFYSATDCSVRKSIMEQEKIEYAVFGSLEKKKYPALNPSSFSCLKPVIEDSDYVLYGL